MRDASYYKDNESSFRVVIALPSPIHIASILLILWFLPYIREFTIFQSPIQRIFSNLNNSWLCSQNIVCLFNIVVLPYVFIEFRLWKLRHYSLDLLRIIISHKIFDRLQCISILLWVHHFEDCFEILFWQGVTAHVYWKKTQYIIWTCKSFYYF